jgi:hypothetical protein
MDAANNNEATPEKTSDDAAAESSAEADADAVADETETVDDIDPEAPEEELPFIYSITSYGADYPVDALVSRLEAEDIIVPPFQRGFIWPRARIDRFVESLLLGLPVPGIFLANEPGTNKLLVIDGQQRLSTLHAFYLGVLRGREFALGEGVQDQFTGRTYKSLEEEDRRRLDNSIIHATVIRQDQPSDDQSSIYFVFERLNTGGTFLQPQEIRAAIFQGPFNELLHALNEYEPWRQVFGRPSKRLKDQELILRFLAFHYKGEDYERPMKEFLNDFMGVNRDLESLGREQVEGAFKGVIDLLCQAVGPEKVFRPGGRAINAAVFDAVTVGVADRLSQNGPPDPGAVAAAYGDLLSNDRFIAAYSRATADEASVSQRLELAKQRFAEV